MFVLVGITEVVFSVLIVKFLKKSCFLYDLISFLDA